MINSDLRAKISLDSGIAALTLRLFFSS